MAVAKSICLNIEDLIRSTTHWFATNEQNEIELKMTKRKSEDTRSSDEEKTQGKYMIRKGKELTNGTKLMEGSEKRAKKN